MSQARSDVVVVVVVGGCGIAGLSAAVSALQDGAAVTILERAPREERGGQTRYTEAYLRMKSETEVTDDFEDMFASNAGGHLDPALVHLAAGPRDEWPALLRTLGFADPEVVSAFAAAAGPTVQWLKSFGVRFDFLPTQFLTKSQPRLLPIGDGFALVETLVAEAEKRGATCSPWLRVLYRIRYNPLWPGLPRRGKSRCTGSARRRKTCWRFRRQWWTILATQKNRHRGCARRGRM